MDAASQYALIVLYALAMGLQNAVARRLECDLTTTRADVTLTGSRPTPRWPEAEPRPGPSIVGHCRNVPGRRVGAFLAFMPVSELSLGWPCLYRTGLRPIGCHRRQRLGRSVPSS